MFYRPARARIAATNRREWNYHKKALRNYEIPKAQEANLKIALLGQFGIGNFGNEASLQVMMRFLRSVDSNVEVACICARPEIVRRDYKIECLPFKPAPPEQTWFRTLDRLLFRIPRVLDLLVKMISAARKFDAILVPGTGVIADMMDTPSQTPLAIFLWCLTGRMCGAKVGFISIGAGPVENSVSRWLMVSGARIAHYRSYRDEESKDFMRAAHCNVQGDAVYPDLVFGFPEPAPPFTPQSDNDVVVGIAAMNYRGWAYDNEELFETYTEKLARFAQWCLEFGCQIRLLESDNFDYVATEAVLKYLKERTGGRYDSRIRVERSNSISDLMRKMSDSDILIVTRFHALLAAIKMGKPTISIEYSGKNTSLMAAVGLGPFCQTVKKFDVDILINQFLFLIANREELQKRLREEKISFLTRLSEQEGIVLSSLLSR